MVTEGCKGSELLWSSGEISLAHLLQETAQETCSLKLLSRVTRGKGSELWTEVLPSKPEGLRWNQPRVFSSPAAVVSSHIFKGKFQAQTTGCPTSPAGKWKRKQNLHIFSSPPSSSSQSVYRYIQPRSRPLDKKAINWQWIPLPQNKHYIKSAFFPRFLHEPYMTAPIIKTWTTQGRIHWIPRGFYLLNAWDGCELNPTRLNDRKLHLNTFRNKTRQQ